MAKRVDNYFNRKHENNFLDIDAYDLMSLVEAGYKTEDIAKELSISKEQINVLRNEINKNY